MALILGTPADFRVRADSSGLTAICAGEPLDTTRHHLEGDLDAICAKALRKEPDQRYASTNEFIADLRRHLNARPVRAMQGTRAYYARKFLRRHRASLALSAAASGMRTR